jgi:hypothetical protein
MYSFIKRKDLYIRKVKHATRFFCRVDSGEHGGYADELGRLWKTFWRVLRH